MGLFGSLAKAVAADQAVPAMRERMCEYGYYNGLYAGVNAGYADRRRPARRSGHAHRRCPARPVACRSATIGSRIAPCGVSRPDWQWSGVDAKADMSPNAPQLTTFTANMQWFSTLRGRYGVMVDQTLI